MVKGHKIVKRGYMHQPGEGFYIDCECGRTGGLFKNVQDAERDRQAHKKEVEGATK